MVSRNAVVIGLVYALVWETTLGSWAPGVRRCTASPRGAAPPEVVRDLAGLAVVGPDGRPATLPARLTLAALDPGTNIDIAARVVSCTM